MPVARLEPLLEYGGVITAFVASFLAVPTASWHLIRVVWSWPGQLGNASGEAIGDILTGLRELPANLRHQPRATFIHLTDGAVDGGTLIVGWARGSAPAVPMLDIGQRMTAAEADLVRLRDDLNALRTELTDALADQIARVEQASRTSSNSWRRSANS